jgi:hypothetical protein
MMVSRVMDLPPPFNLLQSIGSPKRFAQDISSSRSQEEMSALLEELGFVHEIEFSPFLNRPFVPGLLVIDAACKDRMIAIEFDGPTHFLRDVHTDHEKGRIENGLTQAKRRFLARLGWTVINNIPYWEWDKAKPKKGLKQLLAKMLLAIRDDLSK